MKKTIPFLVIGFLLPFFALADGGFFPPPDYYMYGTDQRAVIFYEEGKETLILSNTFRGDAKDFGWVVPTPSQPEVSRSSDELFTALDDLTQVEVDYQPQPLGLDEAYRAGQQKDNVYIVETKKIEYYDIVVLTSEDSEALAKWLNKNNFQFPKNAGYILDSYINNKWFFVAVKIDTSAISATVSRQLREGHMVPLQLKFTTDKIIYPLKISSLMQYYQPRDIWFEQEQSQSGGVIGPIPPYPYYWPQKVGILLYVFMPENKQTLPGFKTQYAGWAKKETIKNLAFDDAGKPWFDPAKDKYFLTKLTRWMSYSEMTNDLYLRNAADNNLVNAYPLPEESTKILFWLAMAISATLVLGAGVTFFVLARK